MNLKTHNFSNQILAWNPRDEYFKTLVWKQWHNFYSYSHGNLKPDCWKCKKIFDPADVQWDDSTTSHFAWCSKIDQSWLCDLCYEYLPKPSVCHSCKQQFQNKNSLFRHLLKENHFI